MAERSSSEVKIALWGGYDILPYLTRMGWGQARTTEESYKLGETHVTFDDTGIATGTLDLAGFFDDGARAIQAAFSALTSVAKKAVMVGFSGNALGSLCMGGAGATKGESRTETARGEFVKISAQAQSVGIVDPWLNLLLPLAVYDANTLGANFDDDHIATAAGGVMHAHVVELDLDGGTGLRLRVSQGDGVTMTPIPNITYTFTAEDSQRVAALTGTVGTHVRAEADFLGTPGGDETATLAVAWARG